jgi:GcrA cell cycle regulator
VQSASAGLQQTPPFVQPDPRAAGDPVPLVDLRAGCCKWPVAEDRSVIGGFLFCAAATLPERPYCATHAALAYIGLHYRKEAPTP